MDTKKFARELLQWTEQLCDGDVNAAEPHLDRVYHFGASLVASKEFQALWTEQRKELLEPKVLEDLCAFLRTIAAAEAQQLAHLPH